MAFSSKSIDTLCDVIVGLPAHDRTIHIGGCSITRRIQECIRRAAAWCTVDVIACYRIRGTSGRIPTQVDRIR